MRGKTATPQKAVTPEKTIFRFEVQLLSGPIAPSFLAKHPEAPTRVIDIRGSNTLEELHVAIFSAFDRYDEHMYEFQVGGKKPMDKKAVRYIVPYEYADPEELSAGETSIASLGLRTRQCFYYWFDFGDDWWHKIRLLAINPPTEGKKRYPRIVESIGPSPPQYIIDWDEEEEEDE